MARASEILFPLAWALYEQPEWASRTQIARHLDQNPASIQSWLDHLEHHRVITSRRNAIQVDRNRLLTILTAHRIAGQRPGPHLKTQSDPQQIHSMLNDANIQHVFCLFTAANQFAFYEPRQDIYLYIDRKDRAEARKLLHDQSGTYRVHAFLELVDRIPRISRHELPITSPFFTVIDLRAHPEGGAHADFLQQHLLPRLTRE